MSQTKADPPDAEPRRDYQPTVKLLHVFAGYLSAEFPELHQVEMWRFGQAVTAFLQLQVSNPVLDADPVPVPASPAGGPLRALVEKWRKYAVEARRFNAPLGGKAIGRGIAGLLENCADDLDAALAVASPSAPDEQVTYPCGCSRTYCATHRDALVTTLKSPPSPSAPAWQEKYQELIYAVGNKYPGETRHETALRYIRQAEQSHGPASALPPPPASPSPA